MTREGYKKHEKLIKAWLDGAEIQYFDRYKLKWIDTKDLSWLIDVPHRIKPKTIEFKDCSFNDEEYCVNEFGRISEIEAATFNIEDKTNFIKDKKIAEAYAVLPQLIRLVDEYNEGWKPNYKDETAKYYITICGDEIRFGEFGRNQEILIFKTQDIRDGFLNDHKDLIEIAKPLL